MGHNQHLMVVRGLPGSGKSTFAKKWVSQDPEKRIRVSRDDLRFQFYGAYHGLTPWQEAFITRMEHSLVKTALVSRQSVVVDNQNLKASYVLAYLKIAYDVGVPVVHKDFNVDIDTVLEQNKQREQNRIVPEDAILKIKRKYFQGGKFPTFPVLSEQQEERYIPDVSLPKALLLDVDGTAMHMSITRGPYDFHLVLDDLPNEPVVEVVQAMKARGYKVIVLSGRDDSCAEDTRLSLEIAGIEIDELHMRATGDNRKDFIVKKEIFNERIRNNYNVVFALDDRDTVVEAYRKDLGLPVFQVNYGNF